MKSPNKITGRNASGPPQLEMRKLLTAQGRALLSLVASLRVYPMLVENGKRFVAFFDLLGFGSWLKAKGSAEAFTYVRGFLSLMIRASLPGSVVHPDMSVTIKDSDIGFINFSDSIVFYSRDNSEACFDTILRVTASL